MTVLFQQTIQSERGETRCVRFQTAAGKEVSMTRAVYPKWSAWTVIYGPSRRSLGKTFSTPDEMIAHYRSIRPEILEAMRLLA